MKTARFTKVVEKCGEPEIYLALMAPAKDHTLQAAVKAQRIMTVWQESVGAKADRGEVGFEPGPARQYLVFPQSLRAFAGRTVVGIKYDLLRSRDVPKSKQGEPPRPRKDPKLKRAPVHSEKPETLAAEKVVAIFSEDKSIPTAPSNGNHRTSSLRVGRSKRFRIGGTSPH